MDEEAKLELAQGIQTIKSFSCQHKPTCDEVDRGACCNSCWARKWAEGFEKLVGPLPDSSPKKPFPVS